MTSLPGSCGPSPSRSDSYAEQQPVLPTEQLVEPPATPSSALMNSSSSNSFEVVLADQLRCLQEVLTAHHKQELVSVHERPSSSEDKDDILHAHPSSNLLPSINHAPIVQRNPSVTFNESVFELACAPSTLASVGRSSAPSTFASEGRSASAISIVSHSKSLFRRQSSRTPPPKRVWTHMSLGLHTVFEPDSGKGSERNMDSVISSSQPVAGLQTPAVVRAGDEIKGDGWPLSYLRPLVTHPLTTRRLIYDLLTMLLVWYDVVVIPLELSELVRKHSVLEAVITCVWTVDIFFNFFKGFEEYGVVELRIRKTALAYLKSWFILDFGLVLQDWLILLLTSREQLAGMLRGAKTLRLWRAVRLLKFLRFYRIPKLYYVSMQLFQSELSHTMLKISTWMAGILMMNHVIACFWYLLGSSQSVGPTWMETANEAYMQSGIGEEPPTSLYLYLTAFHWAMVQFTPASMEVVPRNSGERAFNLFIILSSLLLFPTFLGSITNSMAALRKANAEYAEARRNLIRFLQDNRISLTLSVRIQSVVSVQYQNMKNLKRVHEPNVSLLNLLPRSLKEQMHAEVYQPIVSTHPFFAHLAQCSERALIRICDVAMCQESLQCGQELFACGKEAESVYFIVTGCLLYFEGATPSPDSKEEVSEGDFLCDQVLWMPWVHRGQASAVQPCELATLNGASFRRVMVQRPAVHSLCCRFAEQYLSQLQAEAQAGHCNDLGCDIETLDSVAMSAGMASFYSDTMTATS